MKNLRKLLAVIIAIAFMATLMVPAFAAEATMTDAEICEELGMLQGAGDGVTDEYLATTPTRIQAAIMFLRLQGLEEEALAYEGSDNFSDAGLVWSGGQAILAYLKANPDLGWVGVGDGSFDPLSPIDAKSYAKVLLEALGYKQGEDFEWANVEAFAAEIGLTIAEGDFTVADLAAATVEALKTETKDGGTLIEALIADGIVSENAAIAAGLIAGEQRIAEFKAVGAKTMLVKFGKAVEDTSKMVFALKRDNINVNIKEVAWNDAKTEATITVSYKLLDGDYTVTATYDGGEPMTATAEDVEEAEVDKITFTRDKAIIADRSTTGDKEALKVYIKIENQYGEDISEDINQADLTISASKYNSSDTPVYADGVITLKDQAGSPYEVDKTIVVTVVHKATATIGNATLTIAQAAEVGSIEFGELTTDDEDLKDDPINTDTDFTQYYFPITVKDQYGNVLTESEIETSLADIITSDDDIINLPSTLAAMIDTNDDDQTILVLANPAGGQGTGDDGTVVITAVSLSGKTASITITVQELGVIETLTLQSPESPLKEGVKTTIPFVAVDQYGNELVAADDLTIDAGETDSDTLTFWDGTTVSITGGTIAAGIDYNKDDARTIEVTPTAGESKVVLTVVTSKAKVQTLSLSVEDAPVPTSIAGLDDDFKLAISDQSGVTQTLDAEDVKLLDQYGDEDELPSGYELRITNANGGALTKFNVSDSALTVGQSAVFSKAGSAYGSETIKIQLVDLDAEDDGDAGASDDEVVDEYTFTMQIVRFRDLTAFGIDNPGKLRTFETGVSPDPDYNKEITVHGLKGSTKVVVDQQIIKGVSANIAGVTTSTTGQDVDTGVTLVTGVNETEGADKTGKLTVVVQAYDSTKTLTKDIVYSDAAPEAVVFEIRNTATDEEITDAAVSYDFATEWANGDIESSSPAAPFHFYVEDQYGVELDGYCSYIITDDTGTGATVSSGSITVTGTGSFTITAITNNGMTKSLKVVIE